MAEDHLGNAEWLAGDAFTAADVMMGYPLTVSNVFTGRAESSTPNIAAHLVRVRARPAYRAAMTLW